MNMEKKESSKSWERPWTTDEIRQQSSNWNLAGDAGLLNHLQQFSQNLLSRTHATTVSLDSLVEDMKTTSTEISNVTNTFLSLANTQFVENRVYDDDEKETPTEEKKEEEKVKSKEEMEAEVIARVKEALAVGMRVLDTHFDAVEVPASDSEEEESPASTGRVVLKPRNPYMVRPLPCLIGSREFMEDDRVGLAETSSDTEESPDQNLVQSSDSDSDMEQDEVATLPKRSRVASSSESENSEPESDRGGTQVKQKKHKPASDLAAGAALEEEEEGDMFGRESPPEADVGVLATGGAAHNFASELAAKLGGVAAAGEGKVQASGEEPRQSRSQKAGRATESEGDEDDSLFGRRDGKFSSGRGLFDDLNDWKQPSSSLWEDVEQKPVKQPSKSADKERSSDKEPYVKKVPPGGIPAFGPKGAEDLFDNSPTKPDEEDDMFSSSSRRNPPATSQSKLLAERNHVATSTPTAPGSSKGLFEEGDDVGLFGSRTETNKLDMAKNSSLFSSADLDDGDLFSVPAASSKNEPAKAVSLPADTSQDGFKKKKPAGAVSIFGEVNLFGDKFSPVVLHPPSPSSAESGADGTEHFEPSRIAHAPVETSSGLGSQQDSMESASISETTIAAPAAAKGSSFNQLFQPVMSSTRKSTALWNSKEDASELFNEEQASDSLFDKPQSRGSAVGLGSAPVKPATPSMGAVSKPKKPVSLFDESDSGDDELLFSSTSSTSSRSRRSQGSGDLLATVAEKKPLQKKLLFDDEDLLFGGSQPDEPGFDIFGGSSSTKYTVKNSIPKAVPEEKRASSDLFSADALSTVKQSVSGLFDDEMTGSVDDIFAVPVKSGGAVKGRENNIPKEPTPKSISKTELFSRSEVEDSVDIFSAGKSKASDKVEKVDVSSKNSSDIFSGSSLEGSVDIFGKTSKVSSNLFSGSVFDDNTEDIFSSPKETNNKFPSKTDSVNSSRNNITEPVSERLPTQNIAVNESKEKSDNTPYITNTTTDTLNNKLVISQKPKVAPTKPSLFSESSEESDLFSVSSKVSKMQTGSKITIVKTNQVTESKTKPKMAGDEGRIKNGIAIVDKDNKIKDISVEAKPNASKPPVAAPRISHKPSSSAAEVESRGPPPDPQPRSVANQAGPRPPLASKPEPPKTLNIRKTTDVLFGSSSNDDEDMFGSSWTGKVSADKSNDGNSTEKSAVNENALSSDTLSALLEDYSSVADNPSSWNEKKVEVTDGGVISSGKRSTSEKEIPHKVETSLEPHIPTKAKSLEPSPTVRSPYTLNIDPTALLPGAKPPSRLVRAEPAVGFDQPAEANTILHSAGKERAKIQVKRRPPSRRARQEALRASTIDSDEVDVSLTSPINDESTKKVMSSEDSSTENIHPSSKADVNGKDNSIVAGTIAPPIMTRKPTIPSKPTTVNISDKSSSKTETTVHTVEDANSTSKIIKELVPNVLGLTFKPMASKPLFSEFLDGNSNPLSPSTDEEDFFGVPQELPSEYGNHKDLAANDSHNLFGGAPVLSPLDFNTQTILYGEESALPSNTETSGNLFSVMEKNRGGGETLHKESVPSSENLFSSDISNTDKNNKYPSAGSDDWKEEHSQVTKPVEVKNPLAEDFKTKSKTASLDDDSEDLFGTSKNVIPTKTEDLFPTVTKEAISKSDSIFSGLKPLPKQDISSLFASTKDADLFSSHNSSQQKDSLKNNDKSAGNKGNSSVENLEDSLFSSSENDPNNLFSSGSKSVLSKGLTSNLMSDDLFSPSLSTEKPSDDSLFTSGSKEISSSHQMKEDNLFPSDSSKNSENEKNNDLFFSEVKGQSSKSTPDVQVEDNLFSGDVRTQRTVTATSVKGANLFGDDSPGSDDLFASPLVTTKKKEASTAPILKSSGVTKGSIFDDNVDDDIFGASSAKLRPKPVSKALPTISRPVATSGDDSGKLFASRTTLRKSQPRSGSRQPTPAVGSSHKESEDLFQDPLMAVKK